MKTTDWLLEVHGFKKEKDHKFFHIELDCKGFTVRWIEELKGYFIEPSHNPTARISVEDSFRLGMAFKLITNKDLEINYS